MGMVFKRIFNGGLQERPFKAHKRYEVTDVNYSSSFEISILRGVTDNGVLTEVSTSVNGNIALDPEVIVGLGAATDELNTIPQTIVWNSINSTFFKRTNRKLYDTASIISIPQNKFGDGIKPGSFYATCSSALTSQSYMSDVKIDDEYGVIIDPDVGSSTLPSQGDTIVKLSFDKLKVGDYYVLNNDDSTYENSIKTTNILVSSGPVVTGGLGQSVGRSVESDVSSSFVLRHKQTFDSLNHHDDWSVSMYVKMPESQSYTNNPTNPIISKRWVHYDALANKNVISHHHTYPFDLAIYNDLTTDMNGKLYFGVSDGKWNSSISQEGSFITSSTEINDNQWHSIIINKTGSDYQLYVDGTLEDTLDGSYIGSTNNEKDITIFCDHVTYTDDYTGTTGSFDEVNVFRTSLNSENISSLTNNDWYSGSFTQTNEIGYIFYKHGVVVVSDPRPKYKNFFLGDGNWDYTNKPFEFNYRATKRVEEVSILCEIGKDEFNTSSNPSLRLTSNESDPRLQPFVTGSDFRPYVTQVGLYNDSGDLLAIAKLGSPLKKRQDVDVTINVRFDID